MLDDLLSQNEGKTLAFKENTTSLIKIVKTVIAFANTAGGSILIGIQDKTKKVIGVSQVLLEEERISNLLHDSISPMLVPEIDVFSHAGKELLLITVPHLPGPFYLKQAGVDKGVFIRLGSTNRLADPEMLANLQRLARRTSFDETPCVSATPNELNKQLIHEKLGAHFKKLSDQHFESLGLIKLHHKKKCATYAGLLLFGIDKTKWLPDAIIKCVSFSGIDKKNIIDKREIKTNLIDSVDDVIIFIQRNTRIFSEIGAVKRIDIPEYPIVAIREAVINAIVHADYSMTGSSIQISIFNDRIEIMSPGGLPFGQTIDAAMSGLSKMRNPIIGRIFREIGIIETLGMGMQNIIRSYDNASAKKPQFEEIDHFFLVTLYAKSNMHFEDEPWINVLREILLTSKEVSTSEMAKIWGVSARTARTRLNKLLVKGYVKRNAKSKNDPHATFSRWY